MISVVISIGSNCGDREATIRHAIDWLKSFLMQTECSDIYETPCANNMGKSYLNAVISGYYEGNGEELDDILKEKEREMGRNSKCRERGEVPLDMDIVVCNNEIWKEWDYRQRFFRIGFSQISKA